MLTVKQTAARLAVSKSTVYDLIREGLLNAVRIGLGRGTIRVRDEEVEAFLKRCEAERPSAITLRHIRA